MLARIETALPSLSSAERRVGQWVLAHPAEAMNCALALMAAQTRVSEPTVVRFCRSVGCRGFRDFKMRLAQDLAADRANVHADVGPTDGTAAVIDKVLSRSINELKRVRSGLTGGRVDATVAALRNCGHFEFYGVGASGVVALDAHNKFFRLGIPCVAWTDGPSIRQSAAIASERSAVIAVSKNGESSAVVEGARMARANGATVIAVTAPASSLAKLSSIALLVDSDEDTGLYTPMSSRLAALSVLDVVQVSLAMALGEVGAQRLALSKAALQR